MGPQLLGQPGPRLDQVLARPDGRPQGDGLGTVRPERPEPRPVGPQDVSEQVGVSPVILVAGGAVPGAERLHVSARDHEHGEPGAEQGVDDRAVGTFDRHPDDPRLQEPAGQRPQARVGVVDHEALDRRALLVDHADRVGLGRPVDAGIPRARIHPVPPRWYQQPGGTLVSGTCPAVRLLIGAHVARSPIAALHVPAPPDLAELSLAVQRRGSVAMIRRHQGCVLGHSTVDAPMVVQ